MVFNKQQLLSTPAESKVGYVGLRDTQCFPKRVLRGNSGYNFCPAAHFHHHSRVHAVLLKNERERMDEGEEKDGGSGQYDLDASFTNTSGKFLLDHECSHLHTLLMQHLFLRLQQFSQLSREEGEEKTVFASLEKQESHGTGWP